MEKRTLCGIYEAGACPLLPSPTGEDCLEKNSRKQAAGEETCPVFECLQKHGVASCLDCEASRCHLLETLDLYYPIRAPYDRRYGRRRELVRHLDERLRRRWRQRHQPVKIPDKTIVRVRWYLDLLEALLEEGVRTVSSWEIGQVVGVDPWLVRKDLSHFGEFGRPNMGYDVAFLKKQIVEIFNLVLTKRLAWVGKERLKDPDTAGLLAANGWEIAALFDTEASGPGDEFEAHPLLKMPLILPALDVDAVAVAVEGPQAQKAVDMAVSAGVKAVLNLTDTHVAAPPDVVLREPSVAAALFALSYYVAHTDGSES
ncbi:MAG: hypothetical protein IT210_21160 [Armatimonadetes bacterium]|nr:hypothetical protein [Armatimonadota bacterium]